MFVFFFYLLFYSMMGLFCKEVTSSLTILIFKSVRVSRVKCQ